MPETHPQTGKTRHRARWIACTILLVTLPLACSRLSQSRSDLPPGSIIFQDDFSDENSGWNRAATDGGESDYADGMYRILVNLPDTDIWALSGVDLADVSVEATALKVGGDRDNRFGLVCRADDQGNFYTFIISSDGFWGIGKVRGADYGLVDMDTMYPSEAIRQGSATNTLRADCWGDTLAFYVNGQKLAEVQDSEFTTGDVGFIAGSYGSPGVDIRFDDFTLRGQ